MNTKSSERTLSDNAGDTHAGPDSVALLDRLLSRRARRSGDLPITQVGELLALADHGCTALIRYAGQPGSAAIAARTTVDLHVAHVGHEIVLVFEDGNPLRPIVTGVIRSPITEGLRVSPGTVEIDADGERMLVTAREQLVVRCGKASITLTKAGKVLIEGAYVSSRSSGVNRIKGGSVQLN